MRGYRKRKKEAAKQAEIVARIALDPIEEAIRFEKYGLRVLEQPIVQAPTLDPEKKRIEDEQREQRVAAHLKELSILKHGPVQPAQEIRISAFDLGGIIL